MDIRPSTQSTDTIPLRERIPDYLVTFAIGFSVSGAVGLLIWIVSDIPLGSTVGYSTIMYGVIMMLAGGSAGGGYTNMGIGAMGAMFGTRRADEVQPETGVATVTTAHERLQAGLHPEANPRAFWQVVAGVLYMALGLTIVILGS